MTDIRPKCEHDVVYPDDNCIYCMREEIKRLNSHIVAIGQKLQHTEKELEIEMHRTEQLTNDVVRWFKYIDPLQLEEQDTNEYFVTESLIKFLFKANHHF